MSMIADNRAGVEPALTQNSHTKATGRSQSLGNIANIASAHENQERRLTKWQLQNLAVDLLPGEKVAQCYRHRAPVNPGEPNSLVWPSVEVHQSPDGNAHYENLIICNRVWGCPVCASRISEHRRQVITKAIDRTDYQTMLATFTLSHQINDSLTDMLHAVLAAFRQFKSGRFWQNFKKEYDWIGDIRAIEVTYGYNGWHPHIHVLMLFENELDTATISDMEKLLKARWLHVLASQGADASWEHGFDLMPGDAAVREYVSKFGMLPDNTRDRDGWTIEHELTKGHVKRGRVKGRTPWELLSDYGDGDRQAGALFVEYYENFKGKHQLQWSRGLKDLLNVDEIEAEIEEENSQDNELAGDTMVMQIWPADWRKIVFNRKRAYVLELVEKYGVQIAQWYIESLPPPPPKDGKQ